jgi:hypothetical protein
VISPPAPLLTPHPLPPQKRLFRILSVLLILWIIALVVMYFTTVYPGRHSATSQPHENDVEDHQPTTMTG